MIIEYLVWNKILLLFCLRSRENYGKEDRKIIRVGGWDGFYEILYFGCGMGSVVINI